eukprot:TRINITY_DN7421_c0_g1_i1.p1 TRINITY_DN7421_c0_g1~~TRINITY_DN7421_c0_g1_i1.p1  ORF type:complete len:621 (+),score=108.63 TRINITY_DN7421_c0_g1_i1:38-1900(+)
MGKFQQRRKAFQKQRYNPTGVPTEADKQEADLEPDTGGQKKSLPITKKLRSPDLGEREEACQVIALAAETPEDVKLMCECGVIGHVIGLLDDASPHVCASAAGALRNLLIAQDLAAFMMGPGNLMAVVASVCRTALPKLQNLTEDAYADQLEFISQFLQFLTHILAYEPATEAFLQQPHQVEFVFASLHLAAQVAVPAARCVLILSEENPVWQQDARVPASLTALLEKPDLSLGVKICCAGALINLRHEFAIIRAVTPLLLEALNFNPHKAVHELVFALQKEETTDESVKAAHTRMQEKWREQTNTMATSLEILTDIVCRALEAETGMAMARDEEEVDEEKLFAESEIGRHIRSSGVLAAVCGMLPAIFQPYDPIVATALESDESGITSCIIGAEAALVVFISNISLAVPISQLPEVGSLWACVCGTLQRFYQQYQARTPDAPGEKYVVERFFDEGEFLTQTIWTLLRKQAEKRAESIGIHVGRELLELLHGIASLPPLENDTLRVRSVSALGCAGQLLRDPDQNRQLAQALLVKLRDPNFAITVECLNGLIDIYSDEDFDEIVREVGLVGHLTEAARLLEQAVNAYRSQPSHDEEVLSRAEMVALNLPAFINYKQLHGC